MQFKIRAYHASDIVYLYRVCLLTGNCGKDATGIFRDPHLIGHFYAAPYAVFEPDLCFVLTGSNRPCGYVLGTRDTRAFYSRCEKEWFPPLRKQYPKPRPDDTSHDARIISLIHQSHRPDPDLAAYPAHLHIDLLPEAQGRGLGGRLIQTFLDRLRELEAGGVHLGVNQNNTRAVRFYEHCGFTRLKAGKGTLFFGMRLGVEESS